MKKQEIKNFHGVIMTRYEKLVRGLGSYFKKTNFSKAVVGISGGIDSALTLRIAVDALGSENVLAVFMPENSATSEESKVCSQEIADFCKVNLILQSIDDFLLPLGSLSWESKNNAKANFKARVRMCLLYHLANSENALVLGTCNKTEIMIGYFTKFGDGASDVEVIGDILKTEVFSMAKEIGIPQKIINRKPTAELEIGQEDEVDLGGSYRDIDEVLKKIMTFKKDAANIKTSLEKNIYERFEGNLHKTNKIPVLSVDEN